MTFSEHFSELRTDNDIKQKEIAQYLNVSVSTVSHYEKGLNSPDLRTLVLLARYFDVTLDYLCGITDYRSNPTLDKRLNLRDGSITCGQLLDLIAELTPDQRSDLLKYIRLLLNQKYQ